MRSVFIIAVLLGVMLAACGGTVDSYDPRTPVFRRSSLTITAVPNRAIPDTPIVINTKGTALVSGKGRIGLHCYHTIHDGVFYIDSPVIDSFAYGTSGDSIARRIWLRYEFKSGTDFNIPWNIRVDRAGLYSLSFVVQLDSIYVTDSSRYFGVLDPVVVKRSPGAHGYDWDMHYMTFLIDK